MSPQVHVYALTQKITSDILQRPLFCPSLLFDFRWTVANSGVSPKAFNIPTYRANGNETALNSFRKVQQLLPASLNFAVWRYPLHCQELVSQCFPKAQIPKPELQLNVFRPWCLNWFSSTRDLKCQNHLHLSFNSLLLQTSQYLPFSWILLVNQYLSISWPQRITSVTTQWSLLPRKQKGSVFQTQFSL